MNITLNHRPALANLVILLGLGTPPLAGCVDPPGPGGALPDPPDSGATPADATAPPSTNPDRAMGPGWLVLDDFEGGGDFPVFWTVHVGGGISSAGSVPTVTPEPPRPGSTRALRLEGRATNAGVDFETHHHFDWTRPFSGVRFWARAATAAPAELIVALTEIAPNTASYFDDLRAGRPWVARRVQLGPEWRLFTVSFDELAPEGPGTPRAVYGPGGPPGAGTQLHFVLPEARAYDLWLDDMHLQCRAGVAMIGPCRDLPGD